jgi:cytochrome c oxidase assembly protein subunit 15
MRPTSGSTYEPHPALRLFTKFTCYATLLLIFAGGMVTSMNVGLAVPDWPGSYGHFMWALPFSMWKGGVLYEHSHRVIASGVGCLMVLLTVWILRVDPRPWVRRLAGLALLTVIIQGLLGGMTVKFMLPTAISVAHGMLAQIFFLLTIALAYSQSVERAMRARQPVGSSPTVRAATILLLVLTFAQLAVGAVMRHSMKHHGGVAVPDFPTIAGRWIPSFNAEVVAQLNAQRLELAWEGEDLEPEIGRPDVVIHVVHRAGALVLLAATAVLSLIVMRQDSTPGLLRRTVYMLDGLLAIQIMLGVFTVLTQKGDLVASLHVVTGAAFFGMTLLLLLRSSPVGTADSGLPS